MPATRTRRRPCATATRRSRHAAHAASRLPHRRRSASTPAETAPAVPAVSVPPAAATLPPPGSPAADAPSRHPTAAVPTRVEHSPTLGTAQESVAPPATTAATQSRRQARSSGRCRCRGRWTAAPAGRPRDPPVAPAPNGGRRACATPCAGSPWLGTPAGQPVHRRPRPWRRPGAAHATPCRRNAARSGHGRAGRKPTAVPPPARSPVRPPVPARPAAAGPRTARGGGSRTCGCRRCPCHGHSDRSRCRCMRRISRFRVGNHPQFASPRASARTTTVSCWTTSPSAWWSSAGWRATTITYKHYGHTNTGLPRFASFLRVRDEHPPQSAASVAD